MESNEFLETLIAKTRIQLDKTESFKKQSDEVLKYKSNPEKWNLLECIEHLNRYADFYHTAIENSMINSNAPTSSQFKSTFFGNYFTKSMDPSNGIKPMKTFKSKNPIDSQINRGVIDTFSSHLYQMLNLLEQAKSKNLNAIKVKTTLPIIRFNLGDTFNFVIAHNERHLQQASKLIPN